jgi:hypothetical protein
VNEARLAERLGCEHDRWERVKIRAWSEPIRSALCFDRRATMPPSWDQTMYLTGGVVSSARTFCCWMSKRTTDVGVASKRDAVPP